MALCSWPSLAKGSECQRCGYALKHDYDAPPIRECTGRCDHLGDEVGRVLVQCQTCSGNVRIKYPVHECGLFLLCIPNYSGAGGCVGCKSFAPEILRHPEPTDLADGPKI